MFVSMRTKCMQLRKYTDTNSAAFQALKGLCDIYIYRIKCRMSQVRENDVALRKFSGGTAQLLHSAP